VLLIDVDSPQKPLHAYAIDHLPDGWKIEVSEIEPAVGQPGGRDTSPNTRSQRQRSGCGNIERDRDIATMTGIIEISHRLEEWAALAGYALTPGSRSNDGRALFWSAGGEVRHLIGPNDDAWFVVTDSDRLWPEHLDLAAASMATIETYFFGKFGRFIRSKKSLPRVHIPTARDEISNGFTIGTRMLEGVQRLALVASNGSAVAVSSGDELSGTAHLVKLSLYLTATVDDIVTSSLAPDGKPLFTPR